MLRKKSITFKGPFTVELIRDDFSMVAIDLIDEIYKQNGRGKKIIKLTVFLSDAIRSTHSFGYLYCKLVQYVSSKGDNIPAISLVFQNPLESNSLFIEIIYVEPNENSNIVFGMYKTENKKLPYVIIEDEGVKELWTSSIYSFYAENGVEYACNAVFSDLTNLLVELNFSYDDIFRQWNYIGNILDLEDKDGKNLQNYQIFNDVRSNYYNKYKHEKTYAAATGIGQNDNGVVVEIVAVKNSDLFKNEAIKSVSQANAYDYKDEILVGDSVTDQKQPPLFERARVIYKDNNCRTNVDNNTNKTQIGQEEMFCMVSGTASIKGEITIDKGDVLKQCKNTLGFIDDLLKNSLVDSVETYCERLRVYIKKGLYSEEIKTMLLEAYPTKSLVMLEADICRDDLLIEIELDINAK